MPRDLSGKAVLDIGAWDGFFSFAAERRNAARVVAADSFAWDGQNWSSKASFELARNVLGSRVEDCDVDVMDLRPDTTGTYDLVLLLGVLYHLRHPLLALERVASVTRDQLILETHVDLSFLRRPAMAFYPGYDLYLDETNWWGPNPEAVCAMLLAVGFRTTRVVSPNSTAYRMARMMKRLPRHARFLARHRTLPAERLSQGRVVVHAFK